MYDLIDIGVNLAGKQFAKDRDAVISRAVAAGVRRMVVTGTSERGSSDAVGFTKEHPGTLYAKDVPADRLMIETDAPYLMPRDLPPQFRPRRGRNEPALLPHICQAVARYVGRPPAEVARQTTEVAESFFRLSR